MTNDAIIVGGGHNGLVCAFYLAKAGYKVRVLERREIVGGAAVTEEFHPGFRNSVASYSVSLLNPQVIKDMDLARHGLTVKIRPLSYFVPTDDDRYLILDRDARRTQQEISKWSKKDAEKFPQFHQRLDRLVDFMRSTLLRTPANVGGGWQDAWTALGLVKQFKALGLPAQGDLLELFGKSAGDILDQWFETDVLKGLLGFDAVIGNYASPYAPGSAYVLLHHVFGEVNGVRGAWGHALGGMGAITQAMAAACREKGVEIIVDAAVQEIVVEQHQAIGVKLRNGNYFPAKIIVASVHPKILYEQLIDAQFLDAEFRHRIAGWRSGSGTLRMNVALSELPDFTSKPAQQVAEQHTASIIIAPSLQYLDTAYMDARRQGWSSRPAIEMHIPSVLDDTLAPKGQHVASLFCQHFAPELPAGQSWDDQRETVADLAIDTINRYAPNFKQAVLGRMILTPTDLERKFALVGGDIFHGALSLDQLYSARPVLGYGNYRGPITGLYMCGSGTHPGGGVTGAPGHNAAREIIRDLKSARPNRRFRRSLT